MLLKYIGGCFISPVPIKFSQFGPSLQRFDSLVGMPLNDAVLLMAFLLVVQHTYLHTSHGKSSAVLVIGVMNNNE
jgi:hypothetical protein